MFYISDITGAQKVYTAQTLGPSGVQLSGITKVTASTPVAAVSEHFSNTASDSKQHSSSRNPYQHLDDAAHKPEPAITAEHIMSTPVITIPAQQILKGAWEMFKLHTFRHLPVIAADGKLVGILSDSDLLNLWMNSEVKISSREEIMQRTVSRVMTQNVLTARPHATIRAIAEVMFTQRISAMPIVDDKAQLVGILTTNDILRTLMTKAPLDLWT